MNRSTCQPTKENGSLSQALFSLSSIASQQRALHFILHSLQVQLCREIVIGIFGSHHPSELASITESSVEDNDSSLKSYLTLENSISESDLAYLVKHKEVVVYWELLKLTSNQGGPIQTQTTLTNVLLSKLYIYYLNTRRRLAYFYNVILFKKKYSFS